MKTLRRILLLPVALAHVALVMHSHGTLGRKALEATLGTAVVVGLSVLVVYVADRVGVVPY